MVIGIIAVLIAVLLPALARSRRVARDTLCLSNLRQIGQAFHLYSIDAKGSLPAPAALYTNPARRIPWQVALWQYIYKKEPVPDDILRAGKHEYLMSTVFVCPNGVLNKETGDYASTGYSMNENLPGVAPRFAGAPPEPTFEFKVLRRVHTSAEVLLAADGVTGSVSARKAGDRDVLVGPEGNEFDVVAHPRHQNRHPKGRINALLIDGSVRSRDWIYSTTDMPVPERLRVGDPPETFPLDVQRFWFGRRLN